jgi:glycosyltransferase involved in cell wall biosynthesis
LGNVQENLFLGGNMRIAQISPLWESVPPATYGGIELVVYNLTEELIRRGHEVTLFASGGSRTSGKLVAISEKPLRIDPDIDNPNLWNFLMISELLDRASEFDIIHNHMDLCAIPFAKFMKPPMVTTLHGIFVPGNIKLFERFRNHPYVSISLAQRTIDLNYIANVYNGINTKLYRFSRQPADPPYLLFLGRMSAEKGVHHAIEVAKRCGLKLIIAGKVDKVDVDYWNRECLPLIDGKNIEFIGEVNLQQKVALFAGALATLCPVTWREPFGLVLIESMVCGTPVVAFNKGSIPELIVDGKTGFICETVDEMVRAIARVESLKREDCHRHVIDNFSAERMTDGYECVYELLAESRFEPEALAAVR